MDEAIEICKLRLFLKLVAQVDDVRRIEPLPDIDFNIQAGNTLVGFATKGEIDHQPGSGFRLYNVEELLSKVESADRALASFRDLQTRIGVSAATFKQAKKGVQKQLDSIRADLDTALMQDYGLDDLATFRRTHRAFHWYMEFNAVMANGGFDVIVGNPPWKEYSAVRQQYTIRNYQTERCGNLHGICTERGLSLCTQHGRMSFIVQLPLANSSRMETVRTLLTHASTSLFVITFDDRPGKLFDGLEHCRSTIFNS